MAAKSSLLYSCVPLSQYTPGNFLTQAMLVSIQMMELAKPKGKKGAGKDEDILPQLKKVRRCAVLAVAAGPPPIAHAIASQPGRICSCRKR